MTQLHISLKQDNFNCKFFEISKQNLKFWVLQPLFFLWFLNIVFSFVFYLSFLQTQSCFVFFCHSSKILLCVYGNPPTGHDAGEIGHALGFDLPLEGPTPCVCGGGGGSRPFDLKRRKFFCSAVVVITSLFFVVDTAYFSFYTTGVRWGSILFYFIQ